MELGLIYALISFFQIDTLITCPDPDQDPLARSFQDYWQAWPVDHLVQPSRQNTQIVDLIARHSSPGRTRENILVLCPFSLGNISGVGFMFSKNIFWLAIDEGDLTNLKNLPLTLESNLLLYSMRVDGSISLREAYLVKSQVLKENHFGTWSESEGLSVTQEERWERRADLTGVTLVNTVSKWPGMMDPSPDKKTTGGLFGHIMTSLQACLNFR